MATKTFKLGDVVRHTSTFLRSIGSYTGNPINGVVCAFAKGLNFPVVFWSDGKVSPINPVNLEIHKAGQMQMTPGLAASVVREGAAKYRAQLDKQALEDAAYWASPEGQAAKAKLREKGFKANPKKNPGPRGEPGIASLLGWTGYEAFGRKVYRCPTQTGISVQQKPSGYVLHIGGDHFGPYKTAKEAILRFQMGLFAPGSGGPGMHEELRAAMKANPKSKTRTKSRKSNPMSTLLWSGSGKTKTYGWRIYRDPNGVVTFGFYGNSAPRGSRVQTWKGYTSFEGIRVPKLVRETFLKATTRLANPPSQGAFTAGKVRFTLIKEIAAKYPGATIEGVPVDQVLKKRGFFKLDPYSSGGYVALKFGEPDLNQERIAAARAWFEARGFTSFKIDVVDTYWGTKATLFYAYFPKSDLKEF